MSQKRIKKVKKIKNTDPVPRKGVFPILAFFLFLSGVIFSLSTELEEILILSKSQNPISFVGFVIIFAIITTFAIGYANWKPSKRDGSINSLFFATSLILLVVIAKSVADASWSNWYIAYLFLPLSLMVGTIVIFNIRVARHTWIPALYSVLAWPIILIRGHAIIAEPLIAITSFFTKILASLFNLPLVQASADKYVFQLTSTGFEAYIGTTCSGTASLFAVIILILPLLFFLKGSWTRKIIWITTGIFLALIGNIIRTFSIFYATHAISEEVALNIFHRTGGLTIFLLIFVIQLLLIFVFKLKISFPEKQQIDSKTSMQLIKRSLLFVSFMIVLAFISIQTAHPEPAPREIARPENIEEEVTDFDEEQIAEEEAQERAALENAKNEEEEKDKTKDESGQFILEDIPQQPEKDFDENDLNAGTSRKFLITKDEPFSYIPPLGGFDLSLNSLDFAKALFGPTAEYHRFRYKQGQDPTMFVDVIVTKDSNSLLGLSSGYCYQYHNYNILFQEKVQIKEDIVGNFYSYTDNRGIDWESLDFISPVIDQETGEVYYRKIRVIREVRLDLGEDFNSTRNRVELFTFQLFDSLFFAT